MKRSEYVFSALLVPVDYLMVFIAGLAAYAIRFEAINEIRPVVYELDPAEYRTIILIVGLFFILVFALSGLYAMRATRRSIDEIGRIFFACSTAILIIITAIFFQRDLFSSRFIILSGWLLAVVFVSIGRLFIRGVQIMLLKHGTGARHAIVFGNDETASTLMKHFQSNPKLGYKVVGHYPSFTPEIEQHIRQQIAGAPVDVIVQGSTSSKKTDTMRLIDFCIVHHIAFKFSADLFNTQMSNIAMDTVAGVPLFEIRRTRLEGWGRILKRIFDIVIAALGLIVLSPLFLVVSIIILADSPGAPFVKLKRIGKGGKPFLLYKFRSMVKDAHQMKPSLKSNNERRDGPLFKMENDPRITHIGRFIRKTSIDELPQLLNILKGGMSLVGPRPHEPEEVSQYQVHQHKLLTILPGITGMAQVSGRSHLRFDEEVRLDVYYVENWSMTLDVQIIFKTVAVVLRGATAA